MEYTKERIEALAATAHVFVDEGRMPTLCASLEKMRTLAAVIEDTPWEAREMIADGVTPDGMREDAPTEGLAREDVLGLAPAHTQGCVTVPRTVEGA